MNAFGKIPTTSDPEAPESTTAEASGELDPRTVREKAKLSQDEMADLMGMSGLGYRQWETGQRRPGGPAFRLLALMSNDTKSVVEQLRGINADSI